jgi:hypothetical protein
MNLVVGDVVRVWRRCMGNPVASPALVVEIYDIGAGPSPTLLFPNGSQDGFSPHDLEVFGVARIGHVPELAGYRFAGAMQVEADWRAGRFAAAWSAFPPMPPS